MKSRKFRIAQKLLLNVYLFLLNLGKIKAATSLRLDYSH
jgi:hypothetical protein